MTIASRLDKLEVAIKSLRFAREAQPKPEFDYEEFAEMFEAYVTIQARPNVDTPRDEIRGHVTAYVRQCDQFYRPREERDPEEREREIEAETDRITALSPEQWWRAVELFGYEMIWRDRIPPGVSPGQGRIETRQERFTSGD